MTTLLDTSVLTGPPFEDLPEKGAVSIVTIAEMRLGVLLAADPITGSARLARLTAVERAYEAIPVDDSIASAYAALVASARQLGRRPRTLDSLIAATAIARDLTLYTRDRGFQNLPGLDLRVVE